MSGFDLIERIKADPQHRRLPVIVYTGRDLTEEDRGRLHGLAQTVIVKRGDRVQTLRLDRSKQVVGRGTRVGAVYRLADGRLVYVQGP